LPRLFRRTIHSTTPFFRPSPPRLLRRASVLRGGSIPVSPEVGSLFRLKRTLHFFFFCLTLYRFGSRPPLLFSRSSSFLISRDSAGRAVLFLRSSDGEVVWFPLGIPPFPVDPFGEATPVKPCEFCRGLFVPTSRVFVFPFFGCPCPPFLPL